MTRLACGQHWGMRRDGESLACHKCRYVAKLDANPAYRKGRQANGTLWVAVLGEKIGGPR